MPTLLRIPTGAALLFALAIPALAPAQTGVAGSFDRTFTVSGAPELDVKTNSGSVAIRRGSGNAIQVHGDIRISRGWLRRTPSDAEIRQIEQNPPITQSGNTVRIERLDHERWEGVSISYDIVVPENAVVRAASGSGGIRASGVASLRANTGSGSVRVTDVKGDVDVHTGSGSVEAQSVGGAFRAETGSGSIEAALRQSGPVDVSTGSGGIRLSGVKGGVNATTGSGSITVEGNPTSDWVVRSSSGGVTVRLPPDAKFDLRARTGSGSIKSDHPVTTSSFERRSVSGQVRGGGPKLELRTSSGSIRIM